MRIRISDHARIRYLQRIDGLDIGELDRRILDDLAAERLFTLGAVRRLRVSDDHSIRTRWDRDGKNVVHVTTVMEEL